MEITKKRLPTVVVPVLAINVAAERLPGQQAPRLLFTLPRQQYHRRSRSLLARRDHHLLSLIPLRLRAHLQTKSKLGMPPAPLNNSTLKSRLQAANTLLQPMATLVILLLLSTNSILLPNNTVTEPCTAGHT
jgi:hypothetical protein